MTLAKDDRQDPRDAVPLRINFTTQRLTQAQVDYLERKSPTGLASEFLFELSMRSLEQERFDQIRYLSDKIHQIALAVMN